MTRGDFRSRDKDGDHTIRSIVVENPMLHANLTALSLIEPELYAIKVYIAGIGILVVFGSCDIDLDPTTFIYELDPYCLELYAIPDMRIWTSYVKAFESYRLTDRQTESTEIINHAASRVLNELTTITTETAYFTVSHSNANTKKYL